MLATVGDLHFSQECKKKKIPEERWGHAQGPRGQATNLRTSHCLGRVAEEAQRDLLWGWTGLQAVGNLLQACQ